MRGSALKISNDSFKSIPMIHFGCMHVHAHLLNSIADIGSREGEILKSPCKAAIQCRVVIIGTRVGTELGFCINRSGGGFTRRHASPVNNFFRVCLLRKKQFGTLPLYVNAQKMTQRPEILHCKFCCKTRHNMNPKRICGGGENDVINVDKEIGRIAIVLIREKRIVTFALPKPQRKNEISEPLIPGTWSLF
ncbi:hypothetical protein HanIR_Chr07g0307191 [Helianthus annuus]|nr:hypothetical protein HanIR_Chr07g0307191 [Helianthus annuus]